MGLAISFSLILIVHAGVELKDQHKYARLAFKGLGSAQAKHSLPFDRHHPTYNLHHTFRNR